MKPTVLLIYGGESPEHAVSCLGAYGVYSAIDRERYDIISVGITEEGQWTLQNPPPLEGYGEGAGTLPRVPTASAEETVHILHGIAGASGRRPELVKGSTATGLSTVGHFDVVFPLLHGANGEDGTIQGFFELSGIPFVGPGAAASSLAMDKEHTKVVLERAGFSMGDYRVVHRRDWEARQGLSEELFFDLVGSLYVKPCRAGSSVGVSRVSERNELFAALELAFKYDTKVIVEEEIVGREMLCGILGSSDSGQIRSSVLGENVVVDVDGTHDFLDFDAKYVLPDVKLQSCPADVPESVSAEVRKLAIEAFKVLGCKGLVRADFFVSSGGRILINEVNTMTGFSPVSMFPRVWKESGLEYADLITELIELSYLNDNA